MATNKTANDYRAEAAEHFDRATESFDRCDTDGALTQWGATCSGYRALAEAELAENDGLDTFLALFAKAGDRWELTEAKLSSGQYGLYWRLADGSALNHPKRQATLRKKGYQVGLIRRPARVDQHIPFVGAAPQTYTYPVGPIEAAEIVTDGSDTDTTDFD